MRVPALILAALLSGSLAGPFRFSVPVQTQEKKPGRKPAAPLPAQKTDDAESELERAIEEAGNDRAALVQNLKKYLDRFPDAPRKAQVFRAMVEASLQLRDTQGALDYAERLIALRPDDSSMMLLAVDLLERTGDERSLTKAVGYITRVLDRVEKAGAEGPSGGISRPEWELEHKKLLMSVYLVRGRLEMERRRYGEAAEDLATSFRTLPNAAAAQRLGEIEELRKQYEKAIEHYVTAFALPERYGAGVDRREVRRKLGNVWRIVHGSDSGLGEKLLAAYDKLSVEEPSAPPPARNADAKELAAFEVRRLDGATLKLSDLTGKVLVLNFWTTWCLPCREMEPLVERVAEKYRENSEVAFLAVNGDDEESLVKAYVEREKVSTAVVFADGLERFFSVNVLPTLLVLGRDGRILYRGEGFAPQNLEAELSAAIERGLTANKE